MQQRMKEGQSTPYNLTPVPLIQEFISQLKFIPESEYSENRKKCQDAQSGGGSTGKGRGSVQLNSTILQSVSINF